MLDWWLACLLTWTLLISVPCSVCVDVCRNHLLAFYSSVCFFLFFIIFLRGEGDVALLDWRQTLLLDNVTSKGSALSEFRKKNKNKKKKQGEKCCFYFMKTDVSFRDIMLQFLQSHFFISRWPHFHIFAVEIRTLALPNVVTASFEVSCRS